MTPNLRSIVAQGLRSIRSRRNFSSSPGSSNASTGGGGTFSSLTFDDLAKRGLCLGGGYLLGLVIVRHPSRDLWKMARGED
ncbi:unnamed protein product [Arabidopsis lyrata]|nr:unnamed protein product [Arabidopsis lyrata]